MLTHTHLTLLHHREGEIIRDDITNTASHLALGSLTMEW